MRNQSSNINNKMLNRKSKFKLNNLIYIIECRVNGYTPEMFFVTISRDEDLAVSHIKLTLEKNDDKEVEFISDDTEFDTNDDHINFDIAKKIAIKFVEKIIENIGLNKYEYYSSINETRDDDNKEDENEYSDNNYTDNSKNLDINRIKKEAVNCKINTNFKGINYQIACIVDSKDEEHIYIYAIRADKSKKSRLRVGLVENAGEVSISSEIKDYISNDEFLSYQIVRRLGEKLIRLKLAKQGIDLNEYYRIAMKNEAEEELNIENRKDEEDELGERKEFNPYLIKRESAINIEENKANKNQKKAEKNKVINLQDDKVDSKFVASIISINKWMTLAKKELGIVIRYKVLVDKLEDGAYRLKYELYPIGDSDECKNELDVVKKSDNIEFSIRKMNRREINITISELFTKHKDILADKKRSNDGVTLLPFIKWSGSNDERNGMIPSIGVTTENDVDFYDFEKSVRVYELRRFVLINFVRNFIKYEIKKVYVNGSNSNDIIFDEYFMVDKVNKEPIGYKYGSTIYHNTNAGAYKDIIDWVALMEELNVFHYNNIKLNMRKTFIIYKLQQKNDKEFTVLFKYKYLNQGEKNHNNDISIGGDFTKFDIRINYEVEGIGICADNNTGLKNKDIETIVKNCICATYFEVDVKNVKIVQSDKKEDMNKIKEEQDNLVKKSFPNVVLRNGSK